MLALADFTRAIGDVISFSRVLLSRTLKCFCSDISARYTGRLRLGVTDAILVRNRRLRVGGTGQPSLAGPGLWPLRLAGAVRVNCESY